MGKKIGLNAAAFLAVLCFMTAPLQADDRINYRLKWLFNTSAAGDLYADVHGFFKDNGLEVTVKAGGPERDAIRELELGHAQFGAASADQVIRARAKGSPVVVLAQLFQINPLQWIYRASKPPIRTLEDLKGRTIGITYGGNDEVIMRTLLAKAGISEKQVKFFSVRYDYTPFYRDQVDIWPVYQNAQGPILSKKLLENGEDAAFFNPAAFGVRFAANSVVTSERMLQDRPETVKAFISALMRAWEAALDPANADKTLDTLARFDKETSPDIRKIQLDITRTLIKPDADTAIGTIDIPAWKQTEAIMIEQKQISEPVFVEKSLRPQEF
jgi:NitT/TauT family transport system substrate-binding protein